MTDQIIVSGDLHGDPDRAIAQLDGWRRAGITHVLDTRHEWSDADLVGDHAPEIVYGHVGTHDVGRAQPDEWFDAGLEFATLALADPEAVLLVHCHMGINRGPSMAFRILLENDWDPVDALDAIREARPIADIAYSRDALDHYHRTHDVAPDHRTYDRDRLDAWTRGYPTTGIHITRPQD